MSTRGAGPDAGSDAGREPGRLARLLAPDQAWSLREALARPAMLGFALLTASYLRVLVHVTDVVGGTGALVAEVVVVLLVGAALASRVDARTALLGTGAVLVGGLLGYYSAIPASQRALIDLGVVLRDLFALLSGLSVFRLIQAEIWALAVLPAPLFGSWLLALRGEFPLSAAVGGSALGLFVLTGDAGFLTTLTGVVGAALAVALGELAPRRALAARWDTVVLVLTLMVVLSTTVSLVPGGDARPMLAGTGQPTLEGNVVANGDSVGIVGAIRLSPEVRFTVQSEREGYWRVGAYDRYTGGSWVRTGEARAYDGSLDPPPGGSITVEQTITAETTLNSMPALWKPVGVSGNVERATQVTAENGLRAVASISPGESYSVTSRRPVYTRRDLREAGTDYPAPIRERYLGLPDSTPDRVGERTAAIADRANATTPYGTAVAVEQYLESTKSYSLNVERPRGNVADAFLFEMDAGYCTYYATTMAVMLRTQGIPARMATGYTPGERVGEDEWVVRGLNAHAWVEVYFPETGWVTFDPTPSAAREETSESRVSQAREAGESGVDTGRSGSGEWTPTPAPTPEPTEGQDSTNGSTETPDLADIAEGRRTAAPGDVGTFSPGGSENDGDPSLPTPEEVGYGLVILLGGVAAGRRIGLDTRLYRFVWLRYQPRTDPVADVERAYDRVETLLAAKNRPRRPNETVGAYLDAIRATDSRVRTVAALYERAHHGGDADEGAA
ncbi:transglutaminaseTgpA domain-containing protein, partial [Halolamina salifodinae]|uniref:transglutaminase family protein n=1 Tax=Halolamina salifodinae TaxID=1202767 RepID=UPI00362FF0DB